MSKNRGQESFAILLIVLVVLGLGAWFVEDATAQGEITPLDCLPTLDGMAPYFIAPTVTFDTSPAGLSAMSGRSVYNNGEWDMLPGLIPVLIVVPSRGLSVNGDHRWIMGFQTPAMPGRLWLVANAKPRRFGWGRFGYDPCGAAEIVLERLAAPFGLERF